MLTTVSIGGMAQQGLGDGRELMDSGRAGALSGVVGVSTTAWQGRCVSACSEDGSMEDGGGDFCEFIGQMCAPDPV